MEKEKVYKNKDLLNLEANNFALPKVRDDFIAKLENALMLLSFKDSNMYSSDSINKTSLKNFDGAWLYDNSLKHDKDDPFCFKPFGDLQVTPDMFPELKIKLLHLSETAVIDQFKFLSAKDKRHLDKARFIMSHRYAHLDYKNSKWFTHESGYKITNPISVENYKYCNLIPTSLKPGFEIREADAKRHIEEDRKLENPFYLHLYKAFHIALQLSLAFYYEWSCYIRETPNSLGVRIPIHPSSSKDVFLMRNIPEGKQRRTAIVNYVKEHYRTIKGYNDNERKVLIQKHFRGELKFNWRGLEVHVTPSPYDLNKIATSKNFKKH